MANNITVEEAKQHQRDFEWAVEALISDFHKKTGCYITEIKIGDIRYIGDNTFYDVTAISKL